MVTPYRGVWIVPRSPWLSVLGTLFLATACRDPAAPLVLPSSYVARTIEGASLPATLFHGDVTDVALLADTIRLRTLGVAERVSIFRHTTIGAAVTVDTSRTREAYTVRGDSLRLHRYCPPDANCVGAPTGLFSADRRKLLLRLWPGGPLGVYDRADP